MKKCQWIISQPWFPFRECGAPAAHVDKDCGSLLCNEHVEDYGQIFGWTTIHEIETPEESTNHGGRP